jgi:NADH-quinone oxidoreductase subunit D
MEPIEEELAEEGALELPTEPMRLNMGPSHPAMHGTIRMVLDLDGETVQGLDIQPGYLHRGFEKSCERGTWSQVFPYADRLNYVSPMLNNNGYASAVEKLLGIKVPERCEYYRVILGEIARICDHLTCNGAGAMELGAFTPFLWMLKLRDFLWDILEEETGARMTHSFARIGGMAKEPTANLRRNIEDLIPRFEKTLLECEHSVARNRIFMDRLDGVGILTKSRALELGVTGVMLRSTGIDYDVRKSNPYSVYDRFDFEVPVGHDGDNHDRFLCRMEEMRQSIKILRQALAQMPTDGPVSVADVRVTLPGKSEVYSTIEGTIAHFKLVMEGIKVPAGEVYAFSEAGNGELGFYLVSDGSGTPYRVRCRPPCWFNLNAAHEMLRGGMIADIIPTFGSVNMIGGECDR